MGALQPIHLIIILAIVLIVFGAGKLPDTFRQLGQGVREFREHSEGKGTAPQTDTAAERFCPSCGAGATATAAFCQKCGKSLEATATRVP